MASSPASTASITIRNLDRRVKERLRVRAAKNGRSMEAEARSILSDTRATEAAEPLNLAEAIRRRVAPLGGIELDGHPAVVIGEFRPTSGDDRPPYERHLRADATETEHLDSSKKNGHCRRVIGISR